jgi:hypothetical protein
MEMQEVAQFERWQKVYDKNQSKSLLKGAESNTTIINQHLTILIPPLGPNFRSQFIDPEWQRLLGVWLPIRTKSQSLGTDPGGHGMACFDPNSPTVVPFLVGHDENTVLNMFPASPAPMQKWRNIL